MIRFALVTADSAKTVWAYLPDNYAILTGVPLGDALNRTEYLVGGIDSAGWTLDDYVLPRLRSGLIAAKPLSDHQAVAFARTART